MTPTSIDIGTLVTRTPGLHGGSPHIAGKGITVRRIVTWHERGLNAAIALRFMTPSRVAPRRHSLSKGSHN
ncbi:MAG: DUF433 domain-containing protein [Leptolyngbyaceae cyanobacterium]